MSHSLDTLTTRMHLSLRHFKAVSPSPHLIATGVTSKVILSALWTRRAMRARAEASDNIEALSIFSADVGRRKSIKPITKNTSSTLLKIWNSTKLGMYK